jgi:hypothetical protein
MEMMKATFNEAIENVLSKTSKSISDLELKLAAMGEKMDKKINTVVEEVKKTNAAVDLKLVVMNKEMDAMRKTIEAVDLKFTQMIDSKANEIVRQTDSKLGRTIDDFGNKLHDVIASEDLKLNQTSGEIELKLRTLRDEFIQSISSRKDEILGEIRTEQNQKFEKSELQLNFTVHNLNSNLSTAVAELDGKIRKSSENIQSEYKQMIDNKAIAIVGQMEAKMNESLEKKESKYIGAIDQTNARIDGYSGMLDEIHKERAAVAAATAAAAAAATKKFREEISSYNNNRIGNFMSLLLYTLQLKSSPYWDRPEVTGLRNNLPDTIKSIATSNFCLRYNSYMFAFENSHFDAPVDDQRIGLLLNGSKPRTGAEWTIEASEDGESVYLKNVLLGQYLYATEDRYKIGSSNMKLAFGRKENSGRFKWVFLPEDNSVSWFFVQNVKQTTRIERECGYRKSPIDTVCSSSKTGYISDRKWKFEKC